MNCLGPENEIRHFLKGVYKTTGLVAPWQKLVPSRRKVKWKQKRDRKIIEGLEGMPELPDLFLFVEPCGPEGILTSPRSDRPIFLATFSTDQRWPSLVQSML